MNFQGFITYCIQELYLLGNQDKIEMGTFMMINDILNNIRQSLLMLLRSLQLVLIGY